MAFQLPNQLYSAKKLTSIDYVRPADWPVIIDTPKEVKFLVNDTGDRTIILRTAFDKILFAENIYIDWGDGSGITTISTNTSTNTIHTYTLGAGTPCSRGYTTFVIRVWGDLDSTITDCKIFNNASGLTTYYSRFVNVGVLEAYFGDALRIQFANYFDSYASTSLGSYFTLEYVKLPTTIGAAYTTLDKCFSNCSNLKKVDLPKSIETGACVLSLIQTFQFCPELVNITFPYVDISNNQFINAYRATGNGLIPFCYSLRSVFQYRSDGSITNTLTGFKSISQAFGANTPVLTSISVDVSLMDSNAPFNGSLSSAFNGTTNLVSADIIGWPTTNANAMNNMFLNCSQLENVSFSKSTSSTISITTNSMFGNCVSLKGVIVFPRGILLTDCSSMFSNCNNIIGVNFDNNSQPGITALSTMFSNCYNLSSNYLSLPVPTPAGGIAANNMFANCYTLTKVDLTNFSKANNLVSTFSGCQALQEVILPATLTLTTTINTCFTNCFSLKSVVFPASMTALITLTNVFNNCYSLTSVILPTSVAANSNFNGIFTNCFSLKSVVLPTLTLTPVANSSASMFNGCASIKSVDMTPFGTTLTSLNSTFLNCFTLESVSLPSMRSCISFGSAFGNCLNLKTISGTETMGSITSNVDFSTLSGGTQQLPGLTLSCRIGKIDVSSLSSEKPLFSYLRLTNTATLQWTGGSPQVNIAYTSLDTAAIVNLFNDMAATGTYTAKTINITGAAGTAGLTAANRLIITSKGWTIAG